MSAETAAGAQLAECMRWLDELKIPAKAGRDACRTALQVAGHQVANGILAEAPRRRKRAAETVRETVRSDLEPELSAD